MPIGRCHNWHPGTTFEETKMQPARTAHDRSLHEIDRSRPEFWDVSIPNGVVKFQDSWVTPYGISITFWQRMRQRRSTCFQSLYATFYELNTLKRCHTTHKQTERLRDSTRSLSQDCLTAWLNIAGTGIYTCSCWHSRIMSKCIDRRICPHQVSFYHGITLYLQLLSNLRLYWLTHQRQ